MGVNVIAVVEKSEDGTTITFVIEEKKT